MKQMTKLENIVMNRTSCNRMIANLVANDILQEVEKGIEVDVAREIFEKIEKNSKFTIQFVEDMEFDSEEIRKAKLECYRDCMGYFQKLKKKYTESEDTQ